MTARVVLAASLAVFAIVDNAAAEQTREQRRQVAPLIRALTDCVARNVLSDEGGATAYRLNTFSDFVVRKIGSCKENVEELIDVYDRVSGEGAGLAFLNGPYSSDLPRAVLHRVQPQLQAQLDDRDKAQAEQAVRDAQAAADAAIRRQQAEAERQSRLAAAEQQAAEAKAAAARAQAEEKAATAKVEAARLQQVSDAKRADGLLIDKAGDCARQQLSSLVKSGESAEVLASAVMTLCNPQMSAAIDGGVVEFKLENSLPESAAGEGVYRERLRAELRDNIVALAVQAKAGTGPFAGN